MSCAWFIPREEIGVIFNDPENDLLRALIKEQDAKQARVDDRDLSMKIFGCYFSIV